MHENLKILKNLSNVPVTNLKEIMSIKNEKKLKTTYPKTEAL